MRLFCSALFSIFLTLSHSGCQFSDTSDNKSKGCPQVTCVQGEASCIGEQLVSVCQIQEGCLAEVITDCGLMRQCVQGLCMNKINVIPTQDMSFAKDMSSMMRDMASDMPSTEDMLADDMRRIKTDMSAPCYDDSLTPGVYEPSKTCPFRILFVGTDEVTTPALVQGFLGLVTDAGWPAPTVEFVTGKDVTLLAQAQDQRVKDKLTKESWNVLVLQEKALQATEEQGNAIEVKQGVEELATMLFNFSPDAHIVLMEPWAFGANHPVYSEAFTSPPAGSPQMQAQIRAQLNAVTTINRPSADPYKALISPVGQVWERWRQIPGAQPLVAANHQQATLAGTYLSILTLYTTLYQRSTSGEPVIQGLDKTLGEAMQEEVDLFSNIPIGGGPVDTKTLVLDTLSVGEKIGIDFGPANATSSPPWSNQSELGTSSLRNMLTLGNNPTRIDLHITKKFDGVNTDGTMGNTFGFPEQAAQDSLWVGSFNSHQDALGRVGGVMLRQLDPQGTYTVRVFASREGDDEGRGRLSRYTIGEVTQDLEASDNTSQIAEFQNVKSDPYGQVVLEVQVSPLGASKFGYLGTLEVTREN